MTSRINVLALGPLMTNCYVLSCTESGEAAIIDPGWDGHRVNEVIDREGLKVTRILLTHAHFDHVGGLAEVKRFTDASIYAHADATKMLSEAPEMARLFGMTLEAPPVPDAFVVDGEKVLVGTIELEVLYTPGHAPGHVSYLARSVPAVFGGDALFKDGIGRTDFPGGDYALLMDSIRSKLLPLPPETYVLSGHGPATTIGDEILRNPFLQ